MEIETEESLLQKCRTQIEHRLNWGSSDAWATHDYELLSRKIYDVTNVNLSVATLKRIWGKIRYDSKPTITTLNTLAQYIEYENWRAFVQHHSAARENGHAPALNGHSHEDAPDPRKKSRSNFIKIAACFIVLLVTAGIVYFKTSQKPVSSPLNPSSFEFSSKKIVDVGVPNTVIFDYDASSATASDTIYIQQSWDKRLRGQVTHLEKQHTSIYYYPGFFQAKLIVNEQIMKEHNLFIKTDGWLPLVEQRPVPVYFKESDAVHDGTMSLTKEQIQSFNVDLQPTTPWTDFYNVRDFEGLTSEAFKFETEIRNDYKDGSAACQFAMIQVLLEGATLTLPLSIPGCVSELNFMGKDGKKTDLSALGVDLSKWVKVVCVIQDNLITVNINDNPAFTIPQVMPATKIVGLVYRFQGTGSVNSLKLSRVNGDTVYEENF